MPRTIMMNWPCIVSGYRRIALGMLLGFAVAAVLFACAEPQWEGNAVLQIGQLGGGNAGDHASGGNENFLESPDSIALKMLRPAFIKTTLQCADYPDLLMSMLPRHYYGKGKLSVQAFSSGMVEITIQAPSPDAAQRIVACAANAIVDGHRKQIDERAHYAKGAMGEPYSKPTTMIGQVEVTDRPVSPNMCVYTILGLFLGAVLSYGLLLLKKPS